MQIIGSSRFDFCLRNIQIRITFQKGKFLRKRFQMQYFPLFFKVAGKKVLVTGGGHVAIPKLRLLLKTNAEIVVFASNPDPQVLEWENAEVLIVHRRPIKLSDFDNAAFIYAA